MLSGRRPFKSGAPETHGILSWASKLSAPLSSDPTNSLNGFQYETHSCRDPSLNSDEKVHGVRKVRCRDPGNLNRQWVRRDDTLFGILLVVCKQNINPLNCRKVLERILWLSRLPEPDTNHRRPLIPPEGYTREGVSCKQSTEPLRRKVTPWTPNSNYDNHYRHDQYSAPHRTVPTPITFPVLTRTLVRDNEWHPYQNPFSEVTRR